jgi:Ca2+-binding EF-hand superfamily protein
MKQVARFCVLTVLIAPHLAAAAASVDASGFIAFNLIDSDANGYVSRIEARSISRVERAFDSADANRDGLLDRDEYTRVRPAREAD